MLNFYRNCGIATILNINILWPYIVTRKQKKLLSKPSFHFVEGINMDICKVFFSLACFFLQVEAMV